MAPHQHSNRQPTTGPLHRPVLGIAGEQGRGGEGGAAGLWRRLQLSRPRSALPSHPSICPLLFFSPSFSLPLCSHSATVSSSSGRSLSIRPPPRPLTPPQPHVPAARPCGPRLAPESAEPRASSPPPAGNASAPTSLFRPRPRLSTSLWSCASTPREHRFPRPHLPLAEAAPRRKPSPTAAPRRHGLIQRRIRSAAAAIGLPVPARTRKAPRRASPCLGMLGRPPSSPTPATVTSATGKGLQGGGAQIRVGIKEMWARTRGSQ